MANSPWHPWLRFQVRLAVLEKLGGIWADATPSWLALMDGSLHRLEPETLKRIESGGAILKAGEGLPPSRVVRGRALGDLDGIYTGSCACTRAHDG